MKHARKLLSVLLVLCLLMSLTACGGQSQEATTDAADAAADKVILAVSFGTSYNDTREETIGAIEQALAEAYPDYQVRRAFTAQTVIDILKERDGLEVDNVTQAMARLVVDEVKEVIIQPTHVMPGFEYDDILAEVAPYAEEFEKFRIAEPLLSEDSDYDALIASITEETAAYNEPGTAIVFMGHGTHHSANSTYTTLQKKITEAGYDNYFIGTVEANPDLEEVMGLVEAYGAQKVVLLPLMIVAGDHANNDMAGDEEDSWKTAFQNAGYEVECVLQGLGQYAGVQQLVVQHCGMAMATPDPMTAENIKEGTYAIEVKSNSSMFKVTDCQLEVKDGAMVAHMTMSGDGYGMMYMGGHGDAAEADSPDTYIQVVPNEEGKATFACPVECLNVKTNCAAWSIKKEKWYDRVLVFQSDAIPAEALVTE